MIAVSLPTRFFVTAFIYLCVLRVFGAGIPIPFPNAPFEGGPPAQNADWIVLRSAASTVFLKDGEHAAIGQYYLGNCTSAHFNYNTCMLNDVPTSHCYARQKRCPTGWMTTTNVDWNTSSFCHKFTWYWVCTNSF